MSKQRDEISGDDIRTGRLLQAGGCALAELGEGGVTLLSDCDIRQAVGEVNKGTVFQALHIDGKRIEWDKSGELTIKELKTIIPRAEAAMHEELTALENLGARAMDRRVLLRASCDARCLSVMADDGMTLSFIATRLKDYDDYVMRKMYVIALGLMELNGKIYDRGESSEIFG